MYVPFYTQRRNSHANNGIAVVFSPSSTIPSLITDTPFFHPMLTPKVQCRGCQRWFLPRGLSQHVSKTQEMLCRDALTASRVPRVSSSIYKAAMLSPTHPPQVSTGGSYDHKYDHKRGGQLSGAEAAAFTQGTRRYLFSHSIPMSES